MDWFLYDNDLRHERVKKSILILVKSRHQNQGKKISTTCASIVSLQFEKLIRNRSSIFLSLICIDLYQNLISEPFVFPFLIIYFLNTSVVLEKVIVRDNGF